MKNLRILAIRHFGFQMKNCTTLTIDNILPILNQKFNVTVIWFFYLPEKIEIQISDKNIEIYDIHDFKNALELLEKTKPDIILDNDYPSLMDLAIDTAAKYLKIPVITRMISTDRDIISAKQLLTTFIPMFFHNKMPFETSDKQKFMRRGRFFLFKYYFLFKTLIATKMNFIKIIHKLLIVLKWHLTYNIPYIDARFANTLHFLENKELETEMLSKGFSKSNLIVTGNPIYDATFKKYANHVSVKPKNPVKILFAPIQYYEGGLWSKKERDETITSIIKSLKNIQNISIFVKLHPSSQSYDDYEKLIHSIDSSIPIYQEGMITDFIDESDLVVSYGPIISSLTFVLIAKKPLILCNFTNHNYINKIEKDIAWECNESSKLPEIVNNVLNSFNKNDTMIENYLKKIMFAIDGKSSERLCKAIENLVDKHNKVN